MRHFLAIPALAFAAAACQPAAEGPANTDTPEVPRDNADAATNVVDNPAPDAPIGAMIDPASPDAAVELARRYGDALAAGRFDEAYAMWSDGGKASGKDAAGFKALFDGVGGIKLALGKAGDPEGAAGSIYLEIPATLSGTKGGKSFAIEGPVVLRRVNNVDGSTEEQRSWHIARAEFPPA